MTRRDTVKKPNGKEVARAFVRIESVACTGCALCLQPCAPEAIVHVSAPKMPIKIMPPMSKKSAKE